MAFKHLLSTRRDLPHRILHAFTDSAKVFGHHTNSHGYNRCQYNQDD